MLSINIFVKVNEEKNIFLTGESALLPNIGDEVELDGMISQMAFMHERITETDHEYLSKYETYIVDRVVKQIKYDDNVGPSYLNDATLYLSPQSKSI